MMESLAKIVNDLILSTTFAKNFIVDVRLGSKYASETNVCGFKVKVIVTVHVLNWYTKMLVSLKLAKALEYH